MNLDELNNLKTEILEKAKNANSIDLINDIRASYLSKKGKIPLIMSEIKNVSVDDRASFGQMINSFKKELTEIIDIKIKSFSKTEKLQTFDITQPGQWNSIGSSHPISIVTDKICNIFQKIGFTIAEGPDIETSWNNFDALNTPDDHSSRDSQDTFYLKNKDLLRCHTSPVQIRYMKSHNPPIRIISPGRCYRRDTPDSTHSANFHQIEGLYVDENVTLADLKGTVSYFANELLGESVKTRFRPHFFPFTEPSFEVDFMHPTAGWIEVLGAGLVHPNVFENVEYDDSKISGFAFGMGIERIVMILYDIKDIRDLYENDLRFLKQF
tara:strand:- start:592 stop:1566 length:975 start_codon:yes stop_codon:yes gene_type:complete